MLKVIALFFLYCSSFILNAKPFIDQDVVKAFHSKNSTSFISLLVFFKSIEQTDFFIRELQSTPSLSINRLDFMPVAIATFSSNDMTFQKISSFPDVLYLALNQPAGEKIEISSESSKPKVPFRYPGIDLWWEHGYKGQNEVVGLIDSGIAPDHPAFKGKKIIINKSAHSDYTYYPYGVRTAHGTGVGCIYAGYPQDKNRRIRGIAYKTPVILSTLAGEGSKRQQDFWLTYSSLNWLLSFPKYQPSVINYSFGNGDITCPSCPDWSGMSKIVDYIVNQKKYYGSLRPVIMVLLNKKNIGLMPQL